jgi:Tol biopolymer transport system component/predicted Ser/Thr protein kinase
MTLASGARLGPYEILSPLGSGGMGEVYRAHDTKLGREVAIKVLPEAFAREPDRLSRFQREAKMLAALNHPAIATIYGLEQSNDTSYLVMELVSGETLQQHVAREGRLPIDEALGTCRQIAEALEAAHEKGIIHRDLKPANVKVTPEGKVKVLDFGLAKAFAGGDSSSDPSNSPTLSAAGTMHGVILGTAAYMSPEQARGKVVDKRTDIWAFGCVLYELLTGQQAFHGDTVTEILAAVLRGEPDWPALPAATPTKARDLLRRCLQKDKTLRERDAGDACMEIQEALAAASVSPPTRGFARRGWREAVVLGLAGLAVAVVAGLAVWDLKLAAPQAPRPVSRFTITLPPGQQLAGLDTGPALALSPDGTRLAYVASQGGPQQLYLRAMDSLEAKLVPGTEGAVEPFFSPDGQWLGFFAGGKLKKISVSGGAAVALDDAGRNPRGAGWGSQGLIAFAATGVSALFLQGSDAGGTPQPLTRLGKGENGHRWPEFLPGGKAVLFAFSTNSTNWTNAQVAVQSIGTGERRNLIPGGTQPRYAPSGDLVYAQGGSLMAVAFDPQRLTAAGPAVPVVEGVLQSLATGAAQYSISATGSLVYVAGGVQMNRGQSRLVWVSRSGAEQPLAAPAHTYQAPRLSPVDRRVAVSIQEQGTQVGLYDLSRDTLTPLTFEGGQFPIWTLDGKRVAFFSGAPMNLFWQAADGSGTAERLTTSEHFQNPGSFSPDGTLLAFSQGAGPVNRDLWILRLSDRKPQPFLQTPVNKSVPLFSPDGRWLVYVSTESGRPEIYAQPYPGPGGKRQITTEGGSEPVWNRNDRELFYRNGNKMMAVDITTQPSFSAGKPRVLFDGQYLPSGLDIPNYDVSADGQHFLMLKPAEQAQAAPMQINVVLNWFEELKQKVPAGSKK